MARRKFARRGKKDWDSGNGISRFEKAFHHGTEITKKV
jgi:hypothetical protein